MSEENLLDDCQLSGVNGGDPGVGNVDLKYMFKNYLKAGANKVQRLFGATDQSVTFKDDPVAKAWYGPGGEAAYKDYPPGYMDGPFGPIH